MSAPLRDDLAARASWAVQQGAALGMAQHTGEIEAVALWLAARPVRDVLEIGGLHGGTAVLFGHLGAARVVSIDLPNGRFGGHDHGYRTDQRCLERNARTAAAMPPGVEFCGILGDSHATETRDEARGLLPHGVDVLFIDGDHTLEGVTADYRLYATFVRPGGAIVFHDVNDTAFHHDAGCFVDQLWAQIVAEHPGRTLTFTERKEWGGIGVLLV